MNLDNHIEGDYDPNNPANQKEEPYQLEVLEQCFEDNDKKRFDELMTEILKEVNDLRDYAKANENQYLLKRLNKIYNKL